ncbi:MAG TPA: hypothetical protein VE010_06315 [Thermoanaerobaculia bacterium]|nr:hypothetical protein [Thermoanaerobaculia bacterium]
MPTKPPFTLADLEAMPIPQLDALDAEAITQAVASIPALERDELEEFLAALDLLKEHKQYAAADAYADGEVELAQQLAAAADAAIAAIVAGKAALQRL